jgi:signal transduction histidine kinase
MKKFLAILIFIFPLLVLSQKMTREQQLKIYKAFNQAQLYLEKDEIDKSQKWLNTTRDLIDIQDVDTMSCYINSLQSELFYYTGLYEFGKTQAQKSINEAAKLVDSLLMADAYFFRGINQFELKDYHLAEQSLQQAKKFYPQKPRLNTLKNVIRPDHIANNLAQAKLKINQPDSALYYNRKAYRYAQKTNSRRGIPNCEQTFGEIYLSQKQPDSAQYYFAQSIRSAQHSKYYDLLLIGYGFLMECQPSEASKAENYYQAGCKLMQTQSINLAFRKIFFQKALIAFKGRQPEKENYILSQIIRLNQETSDLNNYYLQSITKGYIQNERKILSLEVQRLKKEKDIVLLQLAVTIFFVLALILTVIIIRRRNKENLKLLHQKNEISKDLHDDIGSGLSSILIHSDVLQRQTQNAPELQLLSGKINETASEISQRVSTFVWSLNDKQNTVSGLTNYFLAYSEKLFEGTSIDFQCHAELGAVSDKSIAGNVRKNLFLALKEILNNILKHAQATQVEVQIKGLRHQLQITVTDNGTGFKDQNPWGNGLKNIQNRIEDLNGKVRFQEAHGLRVIIEIPF